MADELISHSKLRKAIIYALFLVIAAGLTIASIVGAWSWRWVAAGSLLGVIIWLRLAAFIYPLRKVLKRMEAQAQKKSPHRND